MRRFTSSLYHTTSAGRIESEDPEHVVNSYLESVSPAFNAGSCPTGELFPIYYPCVVLCTDAVIVYYNRCALTSLSEIKTFTATLNNCDYLLYDNDKTARELQ